jgi:hypothetical protein
MHGLVVGDAARTDRSGNGRPVCERSGGAADPHRAASRPCALGALIRVATEYQLTIYDAAYLELAERIGAPLASLDSDLQKAALAAGVVLLEP